MSETNKVEQKLPIEIPTISRNDISKTLSVLKYGNRSETRKGQPFLAAVIKAPVVVEIEGVKYLKDIDDLLWLGVSEGIAILNSAVRRISMDIWESCIDSDTGKFDSGKFLAEYATLTEGAEGLKDMYDRKDELTERILTMIDDPAYGAADDSNTPPLKEQAVSLKAELKQLNERIVAREAEFAARAAKRKDRQDKAEKSAEKEEATS